MARGDNSSHKPGKAYRKKYDTTSYGGLQNDIAAASVLAPAGSKGAKTLDELGAGLIRASLAHSTWQKYESGWRAFCAFEDFEDFHAPWPLSLETFRRFAVWGVSIRQLQPSSVEAYCSALNFIHRIRGYCPVDWAEDKIFALLLKGAARAPFTAAKPQNTRRVVSLPLLQTIGHRIAGTGWSPVSK
jgi:hypothetical protein